MPVEWKDEQVNDHSSGITDLVTTSDPTFQEVCRNLGHNPKIQVLSSRDGYRRFTEQETPTKIQQLFKLEDWLIAFCHADAASEGDTITGNLYYRLESDTVSAWTLVETPKDRTATIFRIHDSSGKGVTLRISSGTIYDNFIVKNGTDAGTAPSLAFSGRNVQITVDTGNLTADLNYDTGSGNLTWAWFTTSFVGWTVSYLSGTLSTDEVIFDELLTVQESATPYLGLYPANARSDGDGTALGFAGEQGHFQPSEWQSHLYMALEPYLKSFTANDSDPYGEDPEAFPPDNQRIPLRKVIPFAPAVGAASSATVLKAVNAQLPKTYIAVDENESDEDTYGNDYAHFRYQVYTLKWNYAPAYNADDYASIEIWCERTWGYQGPSGTMGTHESYLVHRTLSSANPIDSSLAFSLCDVEISNAGDYASFIFPSNSLGSPWGFLCLVYHATTTGIQTFQDVVEGVEAAFAEYQRRNVTIGATTYRASYGKFGYYIKVNPRARLDAYVDAEVPGHDITVRYADSLPEDVAGNYSYGYAFYLRDRYKAMVEGSPREFITDGPAAFLTVRTLSPITDELRRGYDKVPPTVGYQTFTYPVAPRIFGAISASINRDSSLYFQSGMEAVFARTLDGGDVYYIEAAKKLWYRTGETPTLSSGADIVPDSLLTDEDWTTKTSYIVIEEPETTDDLLQYEEQAYFNGGVLSYDSLPQGPYFFDVVNQTGYSGNIVGNIHRLYQSAPGAPHGSPATLFDDFDDEMTGLSQYLDKPIVTTSGKIWRVEGTKGGDGSGRTFLRTVSDEFGCISNQSIVRTNIGLFLWSSTGIVYTDGLKALRVTEHLLTTYADWLSAVRSGEPTIGPKQLRGSYDELNRKVYWSLFDEDGKPFFVVLSLGKGISPTMPVTTEEGIRYSSVDSVTGEVTTTDYFETHATLYSDDRLRWYRGQDTYLMVRDSDRTYDESHADGLKHPILPYYKSVAYSYGLPWARKQTAKIILTLRDTTHTGVSLTPLGWNDLSETAHRLRNCLSYQHMDFALDYATGSLLDLEQFFKHSDCRWKSHMIVSYKRGFGRGRQRNCFKQVGFEAMKLRYSTIGRETSGITGIEVIHKAGFPQATAFIEITVSNVLSNPVEDLSLDASGQFYVSFEPSMDPVPISDVSRLGSVYTIIALLDGEATSDAADQTISWPEVSFYRVFTDQKIDLIGYNVTYRLIGDRTHGSLKSPEHGGVDA